MTVASGWMERASSRVMWGNTRVADGVASTTLAPLLRSVDDNGRAALQAGMTSHLDPGLEMSECKQADLHGSCRVGKVGRLSRENTIEH